MEHLDVPYDDEYRFVQSFSVDELTSDEARAFLELYGFLVVRNVLTQAECDATIDEMFSYLEAHNEGFERQRLETWSKWAGRSFGMPSNEPLFTPQLLANRQNANVHRVFSTLIGTAQLLVNHDRWAIYRPTLLVGDEYRTRDNVHLDINPWRFQQDDASLWREVDANLTYAAVRDFIAENNQVTRSTRGRQFQAVLNLLDNEEADGGFVIVPGFHRYFERWTQSVAMTHTECKYAFRDKDPIAKAAVRIPCAAGSMIVWDQRCAHGSRGNRSDRMRAIQFLKMFSSEGMDERRRLARRRCLQRLVRSSTTAISDVGRIVFDLQD